MRSDLVKLLSALMLAVLALGPLDARASRPSPNSERGEIAPQEAPRPTPFAVPPPEPTASGALLHDSVFDLGVEPDVLNPLSAATRSVRSFEPLFGVKLTGVERLRGPPGPSLENRIWNLRVLGQNVVVVAEGVSTRLVWSCGGAGYDASWYDCARSEYEGSAPFRKHQTLWRVLEYDKQTRPCYVKYRWYDPETGSFVSADPLGFPDSMNQYAWGVGNYWKADPLGLAEEGAAGFWAGAGAWTLSKMGLRPSPPNPTTQQYSELQGVVPELTDKPSSQPRGGTRTERTVGAVFNREASAVIGIVGAAGQEVVIQVVIAEAGGKVIQVVTRVGGKVLARGFKTVQEAWIAAKEGKAASIVVEDLAVAKGAQGVVPASRTTSQNSAELSRNLTREARPVAEGEAAGHIVASTGTSGHWAASARSRVLLERYGIGINDAANGIPIGHPRPHSDMHTRAFLNAVETRLYSIEERMRASGYGWNAIRDALRRELRTIGQEVLLAGQ